MTPQLRSQRDYSDRQTALHMNLVANFGKARAHQVQPGIMIRCHCTYSATLQWGSCSLPHRGDSQDRDRTLLHLAISSGEEYEKYGYALALPTITHE